MNDREKIVREITNPIDQQMEILGGKLSPSDAFEYAERKKQIEHLLETLKALRPHRNAR